MLSSTIVKNCCISNFCWFAGTMTVIDSLLKSLTDKKKRELLRKKPTIYSSYISKLAIVPAVALDCEGIVSDLIKKPTPLTSAVATETGLSVTVKGF